ncbi:hypothetical protein Cflav_PD3273 [Pedosphaera parvula Ellin514]|uniref:Uncharacterized protein n=1 Tax=Pedosphaera parvula (strain Ellin514) TaxID=320771 RepID=B9XIY7_PEDPL|nr:hypothetical protein Cflav_PD3273 [Pedosphaera parvula Ellin514]
MLDHSKNIHSDWLVKSGHQENNSDLEGLLDLRPCELLLTQFDYYRRYQRTLENLNNDPRVHLEILNAATKPAPDSFPRVQRFVQHVSWAPVVVKLTRNENKM